MIYLYCFSRPSHDHEDVPPPRDPLGIDGGQVGVIALPVDEGLGGGPLVAWVSSVEQIPSPTAAHASEHDHVCDAVLATGADTLPARFGQVFDNRVALEADYAHRVSSLRPIWRRITNALEISLALTFKDEMRDSSVDPRSTVPAGHAGGEASSTGMGYAYLSGLAAPIRARRRLREQVEPFRAQLREAAGVLIRDEVVHSQANPSATVLSHLVVRDTVSTYRATVSRVEIAHPLIRVLLLGPHAPYSFVSPESGPAAGAGG